MSRACARGFTLIELLTVIAIISILAAMLAVGLPRMLEKAKIVDVESDFKAIGVLLSTYLADHDSYPPAYGYKVRDTNPQRFYFRPYMDFLGRFRDFDLYDRFAFNYDTDRNGVVSILEYVPVSEKAGQNSYTFPAYPDETNVQLAGLKPINCALPDINEQRPYVYLPYNVRQMKKADRYFWKNGTGDLQRMYARVWDTTDALIDDVSFPPPRYDGYVLIGVGPNGNTGGLLTPPEIAGLAPEDAYHVAVLRAAWLAMRDANDNGALDFDFRTRAKGEGKASSYEVDGLYHMPNEIPQFLSSGFTGSSPGAMIDKH